MRTQKRVDGLWSSADPQGNSRAPLLFGPADKYGVAGARIKMTRALAKALAERAKRPIPANIDVAVGAIAADVGLDWRLARALPMIPRSAVPFAHAHEEMLREPGWRQITVAQIEYDGPAARVFTERDASM